MGFSKLPFARKSVPDFQERDGYAIPQEARYHSYARTRCYKHALTGDDYSVYREMHRKPLDDRWFIREVWKRPNVRKTKDGDSDFVVEGKKVQGKTDLSLPQALYTLSRFEKDNEAIPLELNDQLNEEDQDTLSKFYFEKVASDENITLDQKGEPHPVVDGRLVTEGIFDPASLKELQAANQNRSDLTVQSFTEPGLEQIFAARAGKRDINAQIKQLEGLREERDFLASLHTAFKTLLLLQNINPPARPSLQPGAQSKYEKVKSLVQSRLVGPPPIYNLLDEKIDDSEGKLDKLSKRGNLYSGFDSSDIKNLLQRFRLIASVTLARKSYSEMIENRDTQDFEDFKKRFESLRSLAFKHAKANGAQIAHLENLDHHIANLDDPMILKQPNSSGPDDQDAAPQSDEERLSCKIAPFVLWKDSYDLCIYHMPEGVLDYMGAVSQAYKDICAKLDVPDYSPKICTSQLQEVRGKGIHLGQWRPKGLSEVFNVYTYHRQMPEKGYESMRRIVKGLNGELFIVICEDEEDLLKDLKNGARQKQWVIPPRELIDGYDGNDNYVQADNMLSFYKLGILPLEKDQFYWSSTRKDNKVYNIRLSDYKADLDRIGMCEVFSLPVRLEKEQDLEPGPLALPG